MNMASGLFIFKQKIDKQKQKNNAILIFYFIIMYMEHKALVLCCDKCHLLQQIFMTIIFFAFFFGLQLLYKPDICMITTGFVCQFSVFFFDNLYD